MSITGSSESNIKVFTDKCLEYKSTTILRIVS